MMAKGYGKGPRAVIWPPGHPHAPDAQASQASQPSGKGKGTGTDPEARIRLKVAHWEAFANRLLRNQARKHMFKTMLVERRRRAIIMRENVAADRSLISTLSMDLLGQLTSMRILKMMMMMMPMSQLVQWLLQQVMHQLLPLHLVTYHHQG